MKPAKILQNDHVITDLHKVRERIVQSYNGDLKALTRDARKRQYESGHKVVKRITSADSELPNSNE